MGSDGGYPAKLEAVADAAEVCWYDANDVVAVAMVRMLDRMIETKSGHPMSLTLDEWLAELQLMRDGFQAHLDLHEIDVRQDSERLRAVLADGLQSFAAHFENLWD